MTLVDRVMLVAVISSFLLMHALRFCGLDTTIVRGRLLSGGRPCVNSTGTVKADVINITVVDHGTVDVGVVDDGRIHVPSGCVIPKGVALPSAAGET